MMATFAVIENGIVENIIVADSKEIAEDATGKTCVEYTEKNPAHIDLKYDPETGFEQPVIEEEIVVTEENK
jgi:hypothetical protein